MNPALYFFVISIIMLFVAGAISKSGIIDTLIDAGLNMGSSDRSRAFILLVIFYIFSPLFLGIPLLSGVLKRKGAFNNRKSSTTFFIFSAIAGSILLPFGSLRGMYLADYYFYITWNK